MIFLKEIIPSCRSPNIFRILKFKQTILRAQKKIVTKLSNNYPPLFSDTVNCFKYTRIRFKYIQNVSFILVLINKNKLMFKTTN